jgi:RNA polymerase sigma factor (sigma-70 family)
MGQIAAVRTVFFRSQPSEIPQAAAIAQPAPANSAEGAAPQCAADAPAAPAPLHDKPASVEEALDLLRPYVRRLAGAFSRGRDYADDLSQAGFLGVVRAFDTFRGDVGKSFIPWAWQHARWNILRELRREIYQTRNTKSGDAPLAEDSEVTLFDVLAPRQAARETPGLGHLIARLSLAVPKLPARQRACVELLLKGRSQTEIAALLGVSHQRANQVIARALVNLRMRLTRGFIVERIPQREDRVSLAACAGCAAPADPPEERSGPLGSTWPSRGQLIPRHDYGNCWRGRAPRESAEDHEPAGERQETLE